MINWIRKKFIKRGKIIIDWPARGLREDKLIVDLSRLDENLVGIRKRRYGMRHNTEALPDFNESVEFVSLNKLWKTELITEQIDGSDS